MLILSDTVNINIIFKLWNKQVTLASCILECRFLVNIISSIGNVFNIRLFTCFTDKYHLNVLDSFHTWPS